MDDYTDYKDLELIEKALSKQNRKELIKVILGGAVLGICAAISLVLFLNMLVTFDWLSDEIIRFFSGA